VSLAAPRLIHFEPIVYRFINSDCKGPSLALSGILLWFHVLSAATWFGAVVLFAMVVGPTIGDFTPATSGEVVVKLLPKYLRFLLICTILTPILGLITALYPNWSFSIFSSSTSYGMYLSVGAVLSLVTWLVTFAVIYPTGRKIVAITKEMTKNQSPPPQALSKLAMRLKISSGIGLVLLVGILVCMVAATVV